MRVPVSVQTATVNDLNLVADVALDLASLSAESQARRYLSNLVANEGPRALVSQIRRRELPRGL